MEQHLQKENRANAKSFRSRIHDLVLWVTLCITFLHFIDAIIALLKHYQRPQHGAK